MEDLPRLLQPDARQDLKNAYRPTGVVTFLFTDIEGSTRLWERLPGEMRDSLALHDELVRGSIETQGGWIFKTVGDAFCATFVSPVEAVEAAIAIQRTLAAAPWRGPALKVRIGLHTGQAVERDEDYFGQVVNRVSRLMSAGSGGQILLSRLTEELVRGGLPGGFGLVDLGEHQLKDLAGPERIHQVTGPGLESDFGPLKTSATEGPTLPLRLTTFVGRTREFAYLKELLNSHRLVTLTGVGGGGKTRLALQVAADWAQTTGKSVRFVDLAPVEAAGSVDRELAGALGIRDEGISGLMKAVARVVGDQPSLFFIDNCEHLVESCAQTVEALLTLCPNTRFLITSREPLEIPGERIFRVEPLDALESRRLFLDRAEALAPNYTASDRDLEAIDAVCRRLDGIPLAIELAAARVRVLSPEGILKRIDDRFQFLAGSGRTAIPRQRTLEALIEWSYNLLSETEQTLFRRLSVFAGGWTVESAEAVCGLDDVLTGLDSLVSKSLVNLSGGAERFHMLETVREFSRMKHRQSADGFDLEAAWVGYFVSWAEARSRDLYGPEQMAWLQRFQEEHGNLIATLDEAVVRCDEAALKLSVALDWFWYRTGRFGEGAEKVERAVAAAPGADPGLRGRALRVLGWLLFCQSELSRAEARYAEALDAAWAAGDRTCEVAALSGLGVTLRFQGRREEGRLLTEQGVALARTVGDRGALATALIWGYATTDGQFEGVAPRPELQEALSLSQALGDPWRVAHSLDGLADLDRVEGFTQRAIAGYLRAFDEFRALNDRFLSAWVLEGLGKAHLQTGARDAAADCFRRAASLFREIGYDPRDTESLLAETEALTSAES